MAVMRSRPKKSKSNKPRPVAKPKPPVTAEEIEARATRKAQYLAEAAARPSGWANGPAAREMTESEMDEQLARENEMHDLYDLVDGDGR